MYEYIVEYFASRGHRCIAIDLRGYGNSDKPTQGMIMIEWQWI